MVSRSNYQVCLALSMAAFGFTSLNYIDNDPLAITSMVLFILTEIVFFIKNIPNIRAEWTGLSSCKIACVFVNILSAATLVGVVFIDGLVRRSFHFHKLLGAVSMPVICSAFLLYNYGSYIIYDIESTVRTLIGRLASPPSIDCDIAIVEKGEGRMVRSCLPLYSALDAELPDYSEYEDEPPNYEDVCSDDGNPLEVETLLGDSEEVSVWIRCVNVFCSGIPSYRASRNHRVIERSEVGEVSVNMETNV